jgi:hypothetical protein
MSATPIDGAVLAPRVDDGFASPLCQLTWTRFYGYGASTKTEVTQTFAELVRHIEVAGPFPNKSACWWLKLARSISVPPGQGRTLVIEFSFQLDPKCGGPPLPDMPIPPALRPMRRFVSSNA